VLRGVRNGAGLVVVDPRRTSSAQWADAWLGLDVGSDISLANAMAREILVSGLHNETFIRRATTGFEAFRERVMAYTLERSERETGVPAALIRDVAHRYARAERAEICWTLGITEHHNAVDNVLALINLALLTGHVGRYGSGLNPLRGQNNVQGGGDMGAIPARLAGFQDLEDAAVRARFEAEWRSPIPPKRGWHLSEMFDAMEHGDLRALYVIGENPAQSEADGRRTLRLLSGLDFLVVQDVLLTRTGELADVVFPASSSWCETEGTVTSSERRVQRVRKALDAPGQARDDIAILCDLAERMGRGIGHPSPREVWEEVRRLSPMHRGMSWERLEAEGGLHWPCWDEQHPGERFLHGRLWEDPIRGPRAPFHAVEFEPPVDVLSPEFPLRLTTGRRLDSFNTGVQTGGFSSPLRRGETIDVSPEDAARRGLTEGDIVRVSSRRGSLSVPVRIDESLRPGLVFMTLHFPDEVDTNVLTIDAVDPKSGTSEFKASAIRIDKVAADAAE
jgi:predicted molibdopterin-dependent oxidoreductase YjgC